jgi:hypothetical protein
LKNIQVQRLIDDAIALTLDEKLQLYVGQIRLVFELNVKAQERKHV